MTELQSPIARRLVAKFAPRLEAGEGDTLVAAVAALERAFTLDVADEGREYVHHADELRAEEEDELYAQFAAVTHLTPRERGDDLDGEDAEYAQLAAAMGMRDPKSLRGS